MVSTDVGICRKIIGIKWEGISMSVSYGNMLFTFIKNLVLRYWGTIKEWYFNDSGFWVQNHLECSKENTIEFLIQKQMFKLQFFVLKLLGFQFIYMINSCLWEVIKMMHQFNKTIDYLESTLTSEVELKNFKTYQVIPIHYLVEFFRFYQKLLWQNTWEIENLH